MSTCLPLVVASGAIQQLQTGSDYLDGADTLGLLAGGRLTLTSGTAVTTTDVTSATAALYYAPYKHDRIALWNGSRWTTWQFSNMSTTMLSGGTTGQIFDIFLDWNSGSPGFTFGGYAWSSGTSRPDSNLVRQNGIWCHSGTLTSRYLGTVRLSANGTLTDTATQRFVWNYYNRVPRALYRTNSTSHTYSSATYREWDGLTTEILEFVVGFNEDAVDIDLNADQQFPATSSIFTAYAGIGLDSTSTPQFNVGRSMVASNIGTNRFALGGQMTLPTSTISTSGYHYIAALESGSTAGASFPTFNSYSMSARLPM
jgi:hypothetical protein